MTENPAAANHEDAAALLKAATEPATRVRELVGPGITDIGVIALATWLSDLSDPDTYDRPVRWLVPLAFAAWLGMTTWQDSRRRHDLGSRIKAPTWFGAAVILVTGIVAHLASDGSATKWIMAVTIFGVFVVLSAIYRSALMRSVVVVAGIAAFGKGLDWPTPIIIGLLIVGLGIAMWFGRKQLFPKS